MRRSRDVDLFDLTDTILDYKSNILQTHRNVLVSNIVFIIIEIFVYLAILLCTNVINDKFATNILHIWLIGCALVHVIIVLHFYDIETNQINCLVDNLHEYIICKHIVPQVNVIKKETV